MIFPSLESVLTFIKPRNKLLDSAPRFSFTLAWPKGEQRVYSKDTQKVSRSLSVRQKVPPRSWDSHMHVVEPERYPVAANAMYQPSPHTVQDALSFESSLGIENVVLVQPSIYGTDNSCLLDALKEIGPSRGRGVVVIDPANIDAKTLNSWHSLGVRGVRVNLKSVGKVMDEGELAETLLQHAEVVRPLGWMIQVYVSLDMLPMLERIVPQLGTKVCIDHFGGPDLSSISLVAETPFDPYTLPGFSSMISLLRAGQTYVKISAPYRLSKDSQMRDLQAMAQEFLRVAPNRVLYASDWPHTRFDGINISPFTQSCLKWCAEKSGLAERIFRKNTEELMDGEHDN
ncbi:hypothetical protein MW887_009729 [Aspergillus wentii]|nr:hypothetical protein MW887_009729 [Aspergillus wentii]